MEGSGIIRGMTDGPTGDAVYGARWATVQSVARRTGFDERSVREWIYEKGVWARKSPGGKDWRIRVDATGWPLAPPS